MASIQKDESLKLMKITPIDCCYIATWHPKIQLHRAKVSD
jgi:hypothetical protein